MSQKICAECEQPIADGDRTAKGRDGEVHYRCFKRATVHGRPVVLPRCPNCNSPVFRGEDFACFNCGVGPRIGGSHD